MVNEESILEAEDILNSSISPISDIRGSEHGRKNGWFHWPFNFDPIWLEACKGYTGKEAKDAKTT